VRIPLDYYRILGLPTQATAEQLKQAHRDRTQQLPRREFSEAAIEARKQLIDQAYGLLSDPAQRQIYDSTFLDKPYDLPEPFDGAGEAGFNSHDPETGDDPYSPSIEIDEAQLIGALLILLELGEYELVLRLGRPYLNTNSLRDGRFGDPEIVAADIVLTVALAYLELGREQWQQGQYENAAASLEQGQELLLSQGLFANIRGEMQSDLFKLRPYRILELVSLRDSQEESRRQGISLLEDMLHDRGGIDGVGDDLSGLGVDDFLRFIQQLRSYLTSAEQQVLFEAEARRPSAVATYLAVYALLARGFSQRQPALIRRAKMLLMRLGSHQDVHLEQAVCSLLLGQTEEASRALELSQEFESLRFIRDHSQASPDMLPGLCLYSERWFQNEVFPHFRDLQQKQVSLTEYFADEDVQLYLEELPTETEPSRPFSEFSAPRTDSNRRSVGPVNSVGAIGQTGATSPTLGQTLGQKPGQTGQPSYVTAPTAILDESSPSRPGSVGPQVRPEPEDRGQPGDWGNRSNGRTGRTRPPQQPQEALRQTSNGDRAGGSRRPVLPTNLRLDRILLLAALGLLGLMLLGFLFGRLFNRPQTETAGSTATPVTTPGTGANTGFSEFAQTQERLITMGTTLTEANAPEIIQSWLEAKAAAMGEQHQVEKLEQILVDPALAQQRNRADELRAEGSYWKLEHPKVEILSVETNQTGSSGNDPDSAQASPDDSASPSPDATASPDLGIGLENSSNAATAEEGDTAAIEALVNEKAEFYNRGELDSGNSYDSTIRVRYGLVRQDNQWRIQDMTVLE
jgi:curved DNA-binding protein CbpA